MVLENFSTLFYEKAEHFPSLKLVMIYKCVQRLLRRFRYDARRVKRHLDALASSTNNDLKKKDDEYLNGREG